MDVEWLALFGGLAGILCFAVYRLACAVDAHHFERLAVGQTGRAIGAGTSSVVPYRPRSSRTTRPMATSGSWVT